MKLVDSRRVKATVLATVPVVEIYAVPFDPFLEQRPAELRRLEVTQRMKGELRKSKQQLRGIV